jgi:hypothetical protein
MASFPGAKVHRVSRRKLGRGQSVQKAAANATPVATLADVVITFDVPVVVSGNIDLHVSTGIALLSQVQTSPTTVAQVYASSVVGKTWSVDNSAPVATFQGGALAAASGTF